MSDFDMSKIEKFQLDLPEIPSVSLHPAHDVIARTQRHTEEALHALEESRKEKDAEELRRHNELLSALKEAGERGATIIIGSNANGVQIQQNSAGSSQKMGGILNVLIMKKAKDVLCEISEYFDMPQFQKAFGENSENVKAIVESTLESVENGEDETLIKKSLRVLRDIAVGSAGNVIASGILALLRTLPIG